MRNPNNISRKQLLYTIIKNRNARQLNRSMLGYSKEYNYIQIDKHDMLTFTQVIGDSNPQYKSGLFVSPFYLSRLVIPYIKQILVHPDLNLNLLHMLHGEQEVYWYGNITTSDQLTVKLTISAIYDVPVGEKLDLEIHIFALKRHIAKFISGIIIKNNRSTFKKTTRENRIPATCIEMKTYKKQAQDYARVSTDNNFIHTSRLASRLAGLPGPVLHGACVLGMTYSHLIQNIIQNDLNKFTGIQCRFSGYVLPGDELQLRIFTPHPGSKMNFDVINSNGKVVLKNGIFSTC